MGLLDLISPGMSAMFNPSRGAITGMFSGMAGAGSDPRAAIAGAAEGMQEGQRRDDAFGLIQREEQAKLAAQQEEAARQQATIEWLQQNAPEYAGAVQAGVLDPAKAFEMTLGGGGDAYTLSPGQTRFGPNNEILASVPEAPPDPFAADKENFDRESALWKEYRAAEEVKSYQEVRNGYEKVRASAQADSGPGDMSMIFAYMKMLDPTSVVREGEFATAENAGGVSQQVINIYNKLLTGERLTPELRRQFLAAADQLYAETVENLSTLNTQMETRAGGWGVNPGRILTTPEVFQPLSFGTRTEVAPGVYVTKVR